MTKSKLVVKVATTDDSFRLPISSHDQVRVDKLFLCVVDDDGDKLIVPIEKLYYCFIAKAPVDGTPRG
jgi:hypothetical protein